jgi:hypothetical protein
MLLLLLLRLLEEKPAAWLFDQCCTAAAAASAAQSSSRPISTDDSCYTVRTYSIQHTQVELWMQTKSERENALNIDGDSVNVFLKQ